MALKPLIPQPGNAGIPFLDLARQDQPTPDPGIAPISSVSMPGSLPQIGTGLKPMVTSQRQQQEQQLRDKIASFENPNKPKGFWQNLRHVAAGVGNVAGTFAAPGLMAAIPETYLNKQIQHGREVGELSGLENQDRQEQDSFQDNILRNQQGAESQARTKKLEKEANEPAEEPSLAQAYAHAVSAAIKSGKDPLQDPIVQHIGDAITNIQKQPAAKVPGTKTVQLQVNGKAHQVLIDEATGKTIQDLGESGERPPSVSVSANLGALDRETKQYGTPHQKSLDAANAQLEKISDARSMINGNAEAQGLGIPKVLTALVGGQGTGVRITQPELASIAHARGLSGDVEGTINKWSGKGSLTREQQHQLTQIMDDVAARIRQKQKIASDTLDTINGSSSREQIIEADKQARKHLSDLESGTSSPAQNNAPPAGAKVRDYTSLGGK